MLTPLYVKHLLPGSSPAHSFIQADDVHLEGVYRRRDRELLVRYLIDSPETNYLSTMSTTEEPVDQSISEHLDGSAGEGATLVGVTLDDPPLSIVEAINRFLEPPKKKGWFSKPKADPSIDNWVDRALPIGSLWGQTMVRHFGWHWASLIQHDHDDFKAIAVVNEDRSLAVFPFHYCFGCLENHVYPTILLAFNMLEAGKIPQQSRNGFANLMDGVRHIVPPG